VLQTAYEEVWTRTDSDTNCLWTNLNAHWQWYQLPMNRSERVMPVIPTADAVISIRSHVWTDAWCCALWEKQNSNDIFRSDHIKDSGCYLTVAVKGVWFDEYYKTLFVKQRRVRIKVGVAIFLEGLLSYYISGPHVKWTEHRYHLRVLHGCHVGTVVGRKSERETVGWSLTVRCP
jgi:hypothetical protein